MLCYGTINSNENPIQQTGKFLLYVQKEAETLVKNIFFIAVFIAITTLANATESRPFVWADDEDYWPAIYRGKDGKPAGIFNDILTEAFTRLAIPLKKSVYPWKRAQSLVKNGEADGMVTVYTKERKDFTVATEVVWEIGETLFFRRDNPKACKMLKVNSFDDLKELTLVDTQGSGWTMEKYKAHGITNVIWVPSISSAFNMLAKGRADAFIMFNLNAYNILSQKKVPGNALSREFQNIVAITPTFAKLPFRLLIRKSSPFVKNISDINKVLKKMKTDGTYQRIQQKYARITPVL